MKLDDLLTIKSVLLYIIDKSEDMKRDVYSIVKTAFFAQQAHFAEYGLPLYEDEISALPFGPVPSAIYDILKMARGDEKAIAFHSKDQYHIVAESIGFADEFFSAKESPDMDYLSKSMIDCLDKAISRVSNMSFESIYTETHNSAEYDRARKRKGKRIMDNLKIAKEGGATPEALNYLSDFLTIKKSLS